MNLAQLRFASAVAATKSFTAAADRCHVTQPTLSNGVAQLEAELGGRLFLRTTRTVSLTEFGRHVMPVIDDVIGAEEALVLRARSFLKPETRLVRVGTSPLISATILGLMLEPFRAKHPDVDIVLREMNIADLFKKLDESQLDFVFGVADAAGRNQWETTALYNEPLVYVASGAQTGKAPEQVRFSDIAAQQFVMVPDACGLARATRALFRSHRRQLKSYSGEAMSYQVLEQWAALGIGAAILPRSKLSSSPATASRIVDKAGREVRLAFAAAWSRNSLHTEHLRDFAVHLRSVVPVLVAGSAGTLHAP